jgi:hypothetical protein
LGSPRKQRVPRHPPDPSPTASTLSR